MKKLFMAISAIVFSLVSFPHTESEMLDAARNMALELKGSDPSVEDLLYMIDE